MLVCLLMLVSAAVAAGEPVYRYVDADGVVHYTDKPPDKHAKPIRLAPLSGAIGSASSSKRTIFYTPEALRQAARFAVRVESPTPDQRLPAGRAPLVAAASVMPALVKGFRLVYQVDGRSVTAAPVDQLSIQLPPLTAGEHELQIVLLDDRGQELARSEISRFRVTPSKLASNAPIKG